MQLISFSVRFRLVLVAGGTALTFSQTRSVTYFRWMVVFEVKKTVPGPEDVCDDGLKGMRQVVVEDSSDDRCAMFFAHPHM